MYTSPFRICVSGLEEAIAFYVACGYRETVKWDDTIITAIGEEDEIIGIARLCPEKGTLVLRGMNTHPEHQRQGIGSKILRELDVVIGKRECWCLSLDHLEKFYGRIGFQLADLGTAPAHLQARFVRYRQHNVQTRNGKTNYMMFRTSRS